MLRAIEFDGSSHRRIVDEEGTNLGLLYKGVSGTYYFEPLDRLYNSEELILIAELLNKINVEKNG